MLPTCIFSIAFNTISRSDIAKIVGDRAKNPLRMAKWAYDAPSLLVTHDGRRFVSSEGVRQGDPSAALFFSLGAQPFLRELKARLGDDSVVVAYLDDVYVLSKRRDIIDLTRTAISTVKSTMKLNESKCWVKEVTACKQDGIHAL